MTLIETFRGHGHSSTNRTVLVDAGPHAGLALVPRRRLDALAVRLRARALDEQLAAGVVPETGRLLATRAAVLTTRRYRDTLARRWAELIVRAHRPASPFGPQVPVARGHVLAARDQIDRLITLLHGTGPVPAAGVAAAGLLLTAAGSPVYSRRTSRDALPAALERVLAAL